VPYERYSAHRGLSTDSGARARANRRDYMPSVRARRTARWRKVPYVRDVRELRLTSGAVEARETVPSLEITPDGRVYFTDGSGVRYRVHDVAYGPPEYPPFKMRRHPPPYATATNRYFVAADGAKRTYRFAHRESRELLVEHLDRQLRNPGYPGARSDRHCSTGPHYVPTCRCP